MLTTTDPHSVQQLTICELNRLYAKLGEAEADLRWKGMTDTIYKTLADTIAAERADSKLALKVFILDTFHCAAFEAAYQKKRADSVARNSP